MFPIFGKYDDYGELEDIDEESIGWRHCQHMMETIFKDVTPPSCRAVSHYEVFKDNVHIGASQILPDQWSHGGKSVFKQEDAPSYDTDRGPTWSLTERNGTTAGKCFVHRKVFDYFVNHALTSSWSWNDPKTGQHYYDEIPAFVDAMMLRQQAVSAFKTSDKKVEKELADLLTEYGLDSVYDLWGSENCTLDGNDESEGKFHNYHYLNRMIKSHNNTFESMFFHAKLHLHKIMDTHLEAGNRDKVIEILQAWVILDSFIIGLHRHNMELSPYMGFAGEQDQQEDGAALMMAAFDMFKEVQQVTVDKWAKWNEEEG